MDRKFQFIKFFASALLLISFFLPMSSCSYQMSGSEEGTMETRTSIMYASEYVDLDEIGGWLNILAFTWPIPLLLLQLRFSGKKYSYLLTGSGVLLAVFSGAAVYTWADIGKPLIGAWVGGGAAIALFVIYMWELVRYFSDRYAARRTQNAVKE